MHAIETHDLARNFPGGHGVHGIDLTAPQGSIYGFLGPNGAGKTTTIRLLLGLLKPDNGQIRLFGKLLSRSDRGALHHVGAMVENPSLYPHLSARDNLEISRHLLGLPSARIDEALETVDLGAHANRRVQDYSLGMRQRLGIALALLNKPRLLILDEPTNGLDPAGIADMRRFIQRMSRDLGLSVFLSSHLLGEVEQLATHVGVIHHGHMLFQGSQAKLRERFSDSLEIDCHDPAAACDVLRALGEHPQRVGEFGIRLPAPSHPEHEINRLLVEQGHAVTRLTQSQRSLEALFLELTGTSGESA